MGCRVLETEDNRAIIYSSTTETTLACPIFASVEHAEDFLKWLDPDPRSLTFKQLDTAHSAWLMERCDEDGNLIDEYEQAKAEALMPETEPEDFDDD